MRKMLLFFLFSIIHGAIICIGIFCITADWNPRVQDDIPDFAPMLKRIFYLAAILTSPIFGVLWYLSYILWKTRNRFPCDCCSRCGYNLTGNVSGICPECGVENKRPISLTGNKRGHSRMPLS